MDQKLHLGISAYYHDSAAALVSDENIIFAAQEERYTRTKNDNSLPLNFIRAAILQPILGIPNGYKMSEIESLKYEQISKERTFYSGSLISFYAKAEEYIKKSNFCYNFSGLLQNFKNVFEDTRHLNNFGNSILAMEIHSLISHEINK